MNRLVVFKKYETHPWLGRIYKKLNQNEIDLALEFLAQHAQSPKGEIQFLVNRMFIDRVKPKHWKELMELLTCCDS